MKNQNKSTLLTIRNALFLALLICAPKMFAQTQAVPQDFIRISGQATLQAGLAEAARQARATGKTYWVGYQFDLHSSFDFSERRVLIHKNGGISFFSGDSHWMWDVEDDDLETSVHRALAEMGEEASKAYLEKRRKEFSYSAADYAVYLLFNAGKNAIEQVAFIDFAHIGHLDEAPVYWLGQVATEQSFDYMRGLVEDRRQDMQLRKPALFLASLHASSRVVPFLVKIAENDSERELQKKAPFWLGQIHSDESFAALEGLFARAKDHKIQEEIVFAFSQHHSPKATAKLVEIARSNADENVREKAIFWLGQSDNPDNLRELEKLFRDTKSTNLQKKIIFSISQHRSERAPGILIGIAESDASREVRKQAIFWLGQIAGKKTLQTLRGIVDDDSDTEIQNQAVFALTQHRDKQEVAKMLIDIARTHKNPKVRKKAIFWLSQTDDEKALEFYKEVLAK